MLLRRKALVYLSIILLLLSGGSFYVHAASSSPHYVPLLVLKTGEERWTLDLREVGFDGVDPTTLNRQALMDWIRLVVESKVNREAKSAKFVHRRVVPHIVGRSIDYTKIEAWLDSIHEYVNRPLEIPMIQLEPEITSQKLESLKEKELGTYRTWFNPNNVDRSTNIRLSSYAIDHHVVMPGDVFSFNNVVGQTTTAKGYRMARVIVQGEFTKGLGGGICQTSSTLFNSVDKAGLRVIERNAHSKRVAYVPMHRDAAVAWSGADFKFQNQFNEPVIIVATYNGDHVQVSIFGPQTIKNHPRKVPPAPGAKDAVKEVRIDSDTG